MAVIYWRTAAATVSQLALSQRSTADCRKVRIPRCACTARAYRNQACSKWTRLSDRIVFLKLLARCRAYLYISCMVHRVLIGFEIIQHWPQVARDCQIATRWTSLWSLSELTLLKPRLSTTGQACRGYLLCSFNMGMDEACIVPAVNIVTWISRRNARLDAVLEHWPFQAGAYLKCDGLPCPDKSLRPPTEDYRQSRRPLKSCQYTVLKGLRIGRTRTSH